MHTTHSVIAHTFTSAFASTLTRALLVFSALLPHTSAVLPPLSIQNNRFYAGNAPFQFRGINWFGFNNKQTMVDGLWAGGRSSGTDFSSHVLQLKLLGFNAVRLPFTFDDLASPTSSKTMPCKVETPTQIAQKTRLTATTPTPAIAFNGPWPSNGQCNAYLPNGITRDRFIWVIDKFIKNDIYVVIDYHPMGTEPYARSPKAFHDQWVFLWRRIVSRPDFPSRLRDRIILDMMNEPDSMGIGWKAATNLYLPTMETLSKMYNPLFMVEGTGQTRYNLNWGNGFVTNPQIIRKYNIDDASVFFKAIQNKPYKNRVIISPHLYGPSISKDEGHSSGAPLYERLENTFGYILSSGYQNTRYPVILGEFGSFFTNPKDVTYYKDIVQWFNKYHKGHIDWFFWSLNVNSADTASILTNDWQNLRWDILNYLKGTWKLSPPPQNLNIRVQSFTPAISSSIPTPTPILIPLNTTCTSCTSSSVPSLEPISQFVTMIPNLLWPFGTRQMP